MSRWTTRIASLRNLFFFSVLFGCTALPLVWVGSPVRAQQGGGPSAQCHVTNGTFDVCADSSEEWSDIPFTFFPETNSYLYADQTDIDPSLRSVHPITGAVSDLDTFVLMYDECNRTTPLLPDEYFLVSFDTVEVEDGRESLERYVVHIFSDGTIEFFENGELQFDEGGSFRVANMEGQRGAIGFGPSPNCAVDHAIVEYEIVLETAGGDSYSPDPQFWSGTIPPPRPDVSVSKAVRLSVPDRTAVLPGETLEYIVSVSNVGTSAAANVTLEDDLPSEVIYLGDDCGGTVSGQLWSLSIPALAVGAQLECRIEVRLAVTATGTRLINAARVSASEDSNIGNDIAVAETAIRHVCPPPAGRPKDEDLTGDGTPDSWFITSFTFAANAFDVFCFDPNPAVLGDESFKVRAPNGVFCAACLFKGGLNELTWDDGTQEFRWQNRDDSFGGESDPKDDDGDAFLDQLVFVYRPFSEPNLIEIQHLESGQLVPMGLIVRSAPSSPGDLDQLAFIHLTTTGTFVRQSTDPECSLSTRVLSTEEFDALVASPFGGSPGEAIRPGFDSDLLPGNDDGSTGTVPIGFGLNFFGTAFSELFVNNNGNVTFDAPLGTFTPFDLTSTRRIIIASFFADVDTRIGNVVRYGQGVAEGRPAFGVTWPGVGCFDLNSSVLNFFQLVLIDRSDSGPGDFDIEFNYDQIEWETGQASGGDVECIGGTSARAGFSNGTGNAGTFFELPGSGISGAFLDTNVDTGLIYGSTNSVQAGRYVFSVRGGVPTAGRDRDGDGVADDVDDCPATPDPNQEDTDLNGIGDACQTSDLLHSTAGFLQARLDGTSTAEGARLPVTDEPGLVERLTKIVDFRVSETLTASASELATNLVRSLVEVGLVAPEEAEELVDQVIGLEVGIDVKPGDARNSINLRNNGVLPVAILTTPTFDATTVVPGSVCFGDNEEQSQRDCSEAHGRAHAQDVDLDGDLDLILHYETAQTGIDPGDIEACLSGETSAGTSLRGCDSIRTVLGGSPLLR